MGGFCEREKGGSSDGVADEGHGAGVDVLEEAQLFVFEDGGKDEADVFCLSVHASHDLLIHKFFVVIS